MGHLFVFLRMCSRKISIALLLGKCNQPAFQHPPSLPRALPAPYLVSISLIFSPFINYNLHFSRNNNNPEAAWRELLMWNQNARHVPAHQKQAVLACSSASPETLRMLGCKAFRRFESKWNIKLTSIFILFEIRNDLPSPGWGYLSRCGGVLVFCFVLFFSAWLHCRLKCVHTVPPCGERRRSRPPDKSSIEVLRNASIQEAWEIGPHLVQT